MRIDTLGHLPAARARQLIQLLCAAFLTGNEDYFAEEQRVRVLQFPFRQVPASTHFMHFSPGLKQPLHRHSGDRLLITVGNSSLTVCSRADGPEGKTARARLPANSVGAITIPALEWHWFETARTGAGAIAFSFHPHDDVDPDAIQPSGLMQHLTEFSRDE